MWPKNLSLLHSTVQVSVARRCAQGVLDEHRQTGQLATLC